MAYMISILINTQKVHIFIGIEFIFIIHNQILEMKILHLVLAGVRIYQMQNLNFLKKKGTKVGNIFEIPIIHT